MWFDYAAIVMETMRVGVQGFVWVSGTMYRPSILDLLSALLQTLHVDFSAYSSYATIGILKRRGSKVRCKGSSLPVRKSYSNT
jgi:hypothetical protein